MKSFQGRAERRPKRTPGKFGKAQGPANRRALVSLRPGFAQLNAWIQMDLSPYLLHSDAALLALNKPAGLRSIPDGYDRTLPHLAGLLEATFGQIWVVHRLDKDTSGVILFARSAEAHRVLSEQFRLRETQKEYHAIGIGFPEWNQLKITLPLRVNGDRKHRTVIDHQTGKPAETEVQVLRRSEGFALIAALPRTGYTHQIRAHLAAVDLPILADPLYKSLQPDTWLKAEARKKAAVLPIRRPALHARQITFLHPDTGLPITIEAPYPEDFDQTVQQLFRVDRS